MAVVERCEIVMGGERMKVVKVFTYLGTVLSKHGQMEGKVRGRVVRDRSVTSSKGYEKEDCVHVGKERLEE